MLAQGMLAQATVHVLPLLACEVVCGAAGYSGSSNHPVERLFDPAMPSSLHQMRAHDVDLEYCKPIEL
jgi:hypothetical protein